MVQKVVQYFPEQPFYVIGIARHGSFFELNREKQDNEFVNLLVNEVEFPANTYMFILNDSTKNLGKQLRKIETAAIYQKR
ncbi:MAG: hypothetical protein NVSMB70_18120 [Chamaesiphon sp.]